MELYELHTNLEKPWFAFAGNHLASGRLVLPGGTNQEDNHNHRAGKASSGASSKTSACTCKADRKYRSERASHRSDDKQSAPRSDD